jgi:hypothetical protein
MNQTAIAFLDILGFSHFTNTDIPATIDLLSNYNTIINQQVNDQHIHPELITISPKMCSDSFETFLPFSDSIFITSNNPDLFVQQISHFLYESFHLAGYNFENPINNQNPLEIEIPEIYKSQNNKIESRKSITSLFPLLFRGGISFGDITFLSMNSIFKDKLLQVPNLTGVALVEAVGLEKNSGKGPRIFCKSKFIEKLSSDVKQKYISQVNPDGLFEILWPVTIFNDKNSCDDEILEFHKFYNPALNLWKYFENSLVNEHYEEFLKLIIKSTLFYFKYRGCEQWAKNILLKFEKVKDYI